MTRNLSVQAKVSTLALAAALAAGPSPALAQSFDGSGSFTHGTGSISTPDSVTTNITVTSPQAVIDWTPTDNAINNGQQIVFQAGGTTATFSGTSDFAVLNRINQTDMTRMIRMDGTINSLVNGQTGGSVYFYSPGGFILGATSVINVGSLVLTASPITVDGNGNFISGGTVTFGQALNAAAEIETHPLTQISALNEGSYVAMVAPRVEHHGTISVNGAAALVGAEAATITFRTSGLFDIQVDVGTTDANGVAVYGDITGPASSGSGDNHRVYAVAVPKNTAMTMLIADDASLGFDIAGAANVIGNAVILSAGHNISSGSINAAPVAGGANADIALAANVVTSRLTARAARNLNLNASDATDFASDVDLSAGSIANINATGSGALNIAGDLTISTNRTGAAGESVTGGQSWLYAQAGGTIFVGGDLTIQAAGTGGDSSVAGVNAGNGTGGVVLVQAEADSSLTINGRIIDASADGFGGDAAAAGVNAGSGQGGSVFIGTVGDNASLSVGSTVNATAYGFGGNFFSNCSVCDGLGGSGTGGTVAAGTNAGTGSSVYFGGLVDLHADGRGGQSYAVGSPSADGSGGTVNVSAAGGSQVEGFGVTFASGLIASAIGQGGESDTAGITAGSGDGGFVLISASANSTMGILGDLDVDADGVGGFNAFGVDGGDGLGGTVLMFAQGGNASISVTGAADLEADGEASFNDSDCIGCGGIGGDGTGGTVNVFGGTGAGNALAFGTSLDLSAEGYGGIGVTGLAGIGEGGTASLNASAGLSVTVGTVLTIEADGHGGTGFDSNGGGDGIGGTAAIYGNGGSLDVTGNTFLDASGVGGSTNIGDGGIGGDGTGGIAEINATSGSLDFSSNVFVDAVGEGGMSIGGAGGTGGNGQGGGAFVGAPGGAIHIFGNLNVDGGAIGGAGAIGGNAIAKTSDPEDELQPVAAGLFVQNDGTIQVDGATVLRAESVGGNATNGNGGNAQGGEVDVVAYFGDITLGTTTIDVDGRGGTGGLGGNGGNGLGGNVDVAFGFGAAAVGGTITVGTTTVTANGVGGAGGAGTDGNSGGNGGAGGLGDGGDIIFAGSAAGGTLISGAATLSATGSGGAGGAGGDGDTGTGGNGGAGGQAEGGFIQTGTVSAEGAPGSGGGATYTTLSLNTSATGGAGGNGGTGGGGTGAGGDGGNALGGESDFLVRGVLVTADTVTLNANATGGNGGVGSAQGDGGDATTGYVVVESKDRFGHPTERGTLVANSITGTAIATGGTGATNGSSTVSDGSFFRVLNGDATIGSVSIQLVGNNYTAGGDHSFVSVRDGTATISGNFSFITGGELALDASNGSMTANTITLSAATFVPDTFNPAPTAPGSYSADTFDITTGGDLITNANLVSTGSLDLFAPGDILTGSLSAATSIDLSADGDIGFGDATADTIDFESGGAVTGGNIIAGTFVTGEAQGSVSLGNINVGLLQEGGATEDGFAVGIVSAASIDVENVEADEAIGFATFGTLTTGNLDAGTGVMALVGGNMGFGSISTASDGQVYLADVEMFLDAGGPDEFDPSLVLIQDPLATGGSIIINGPVTTGVFRAAAGTDFTAQNITANGSFETELSFVEGIDVRAGGTATIGGTWTGGSVDVTSDDIDITSEGSIDAGDVMLASTNAAGTIIGDDVAGSGYRLSDAEYDRIHATGEIEVGVNGSLGGALNMIIGDLSVDAESAGADEFEFATYETDSEDGAGSIRVVGDMAFTGMGDIEVDRSLSFTTHTFELDAATGSVSLTDGGSGLAGELGIQAVHVHVAEGSILDQLAEDPQYDGYQDDLNAPAEVERPDGVIRAASIGIDFDASAEGELYTLYVQNTGTADVPAGFVVSDADLGDEIEGQGAPQSVNIVINGQVDTGEGILTGVDVRDLLVADRDLTPFTENSTINGCQLAGPCIDPGPPEPPFPPDFTPTPGIQDEVTLIDDDILPPPEFGNEDVIDDNDEDTEDDSPIQPPSPLFDTSELSDEGGTVATDVGTPMRSTPGLTDTGDIDDPVSGTGNPALMETTPPTKEEEQQQ